MSPANAWTHQPMPGLLLDEDGAIRDANPAAELMFNASAQRLRGRGLWDVMPTPDRATSDAWRAAHQARRALTMTQVQLDQATTGRLVKIPLDSGWSVTLIPDAAPPAVSSARSAIGASQMLAHEIKNPLAGIKGAAQLLSMSLNAEDKSLTELIVSECTRIVSLLDQVEAFGNRLPPALAPVNIHDAVVRAQQSAALGFGQGVAFIQSFDPSLPDALADGDQLQQVLLNLLKNAAQAGASQITLRTFYDGGVRRDGPLPLQIEVIDNGPGLPADIADHVFDPFVSGRENGTGLGLALVSTLITDGGGLVAVDSRPGRTAFRLSLPRA